VRSTGAWDRLANTPVGVGIGVVVEGRGEKRRFDDGIASLLTDIGFLFSTHRTQQDGAVSCLAWHLPVWEIAIALLAGNNRPFGDW
jgi:hypothetical protein